MAHEILSAKLHELDERVARLHSRVLISEGENCGRRRKPCGASARRMK